MNYFKLNDKSATATFFGSIIITIGSAWRSAIYDLPQVIRKLAQIHPDLSITPVYSSDNTINQFLKGEIDIIFALEENIRKIPDIQTHSFYNSPIYLITQQDGPLQRKTASLPRIWRKGL